jgi:hypothetical protein
MKGIINLRGYRIVVDETIYAGKFCFRAQHDRERTFYFYTDTETSMKVWVKTLIKATITRDFTGKKSSMQKYKGRATHFLTFESSAGDVFQYRAHRILGCRKKDETSSSLCGVWPRIC